MKAMMMGLAMLLPVAASANPAVKHDQRLEQAAANIVALNIGKIRGGFRHGQSPELASGKIVTFTKSSPAASPDNTVEWDNGLAPARAVPRHRIGKL